MAVLIVLLLALVSLPAMGAEPGWRPVNPDETVVMELDVGIVIIELNDTFAPATAARFKQLVQRGFYDGLTFYRVIDGFVVQGGDGSDVGSPSEESTIHAEFERDWSKEIRYTPVQSPDMFAPETGFVDGFAAARNTESGKVWLTHCPGIVAMARGNDPDSSRTDFYIVIGQAPRYLDRNLTVFGRVVHGMEHVQSIRRGPSSANGMIDDPEHRSAIVSMRLASALDEADRPSVYVFDTNSDVFREMLEARRHREAEFFHHTPPPVLDVCQVPNSGRLQQ